MRCLTVVLPLSLALVASIVGSPRAAQQARSPAGMTAYLGPQQLVTVAPGRQINLVCMGEGSPTVVMSAGAVAWSLTWRRVQPSVARNTRVCSWDRAGSGFSDGSPEPQDIGHIATDLEIALREGGVSGPLVLVGHSQGGLESLLFADRNPHRVVGMVLVDPAIPDQAEQLRIVAPHLMAWSEAGDGRYFDHVRVCIEALKTATLPGSPAAVCSQLRATLPEPLRAALRAWDAQPSYWQSYLSDFEQRDSNSKIALKVHRNYRDMPLVVLGSGILKVPGAPAVAVREAPAVQEAIRRGHQDLARLSSRGVYARVDGSGHAIMLQDPSVVEAAITRVVDEGRAARM